MKKRLILVLMIITVLLGSNTIYAQEGDSLDIVKATVKVLENSSQMKSAERILNEASSTLSMAKSSYNFQYMLSSEYQVNSAKRQRDLLENTLVLNAYNQYIAVLKAKYAYEIQERSLRQATEAYNIAKLRYKLNQLSKEQLALSEDQYNTERLLFQIKERELKSLVASLNAMMGEEPDKNYAELIDSNIIPAKEIGELDEYIASAVINRAEILDINDQIDMKNIEITYSFGINGIENNPSYTQLKYDIDVLNIQTETAVVDIELELLQLYDNLKAAMAALNSAQDDMAEAEKNFKAAELKYKMGIISRFEFQEEELNYMKSKYSLKQAELDAWLMQTNMSMASGLGLIKKNEEN